MLNKLFKSSVKKTTCIVLYTFEYNREKTLALYESAKKYISNQINVEFKFASFFNESYDVKYGKAAEIELKMKKEKASDLVNFCLHTNDLRKELSEVTLEFNFTRPIQLTLEIPEEINLDMVDFVKAMSEYFDPQYGFIYYPVLDKWSMAYANGDQQHVKSEKGFDSFEKAPLKRWFNDCEKISTGHIRDIFQENFLNEKHLDFDIKGESLRQIIANKNLGNLEQLYNGVYLWKLTTDQLEQARKILYKSEILI